MPERQRYNGQFDSDEYNRRYNRQKYYESLKRQSGYKRGGVYKTDGSGDESEYEYDDEYTPTAASKLVGTFIKQLCACAILLGAALIMNRSGVGFFENSMKALGNAVRYDVDFAAIWANISSFAADLLGNI